MCRSAYSQFPAMRLAGTSVNRTTIFDLGVYYRTRSAADPSESRALASLIESIGGDTGMSATPAPSRIEMDPAVSAILEADTPKSKLLRQYLCFTEAILAADAAGIDNVV